MADESGSRRFWIVPGITKVDVARAKAWRDQLWAEAVRLWRDGYPWHLTPEEEALRHDENLLHRAVDLWLEVIREYLAKRQGAPVSGATVLSECLGIDIKDQGHAHKVRVSNCLRELGWKPHKLSGSQRVWVPAGGRP